MSAACFAAAATATVVVAGRAKWAGMSLVCCGPAGVYAASHFLRTYK